MAVLKSSEPVGLSHECAQGLLTYYIEKLSLQVSGWFVMATPDLKRVAPLWLKYSEDVRLDPEVRLDPYACPEVSRLHPSVHRSDDFIG